jgi:CRP/FNR family transcriptional regulator
MDRRVLGKLYADGEPIVRQGERGTCMYVIQSGSVAVIDESGGEELELATLHAGDFFGEMAIFEGQTRSATIRAKGEARVLTVDRRTLMRRIQNDPTIAFNLLQTLCRRIRSMDAELKRVKRRRAPAVPAGS